MMQSIWIKSLIYTSETTRKTLNAEYVQESLQNSYKTSSAAVRPDLDLHWLQVPSVNSEERGDAAATGAGSEHGFSFKLAGSGMLFSGCSSAEYGISCEMHCRSGRGASC